MFNPSRAGQPVHLYLTKSDIIRLGKTCMAESDDAIWNDFTRSMHLPSPFEGTLLDKIVAAVRDTDRRAVRATNALSDTKYPPYLALLVTAVLPLTEETLPHTINVNNYYDRASTFFRLNKLPKPQNQNQQLNWNLAWEKLSHWSLRQKQGAWGLFDAAQFREQRYVYVGKVFAQCLTPPRVLKKLPQLFERIEFVPGQVISDAHIKALINEHGAELGFTGRDREILKKPDDELGQFLLRSIRQTQEQWTGATETVGSSPAWTIGALRLTFKDPARTGFNFNLAYRFQAKTGSNYPDNLRFDIPGQAGIPCTETTDGWSQELAISFKPNGLVLDSPSTRWRARTINRKQKVWLFTRGTSVGLNGDCWIETEVIARNQAHMYLLYEKNQLETDRAAFTEWQQHFPTHCFDEVTKQDWTGIPEGYRLFKFSRANTAPSWLTHLTFPTDKRVDLVGGLKLNYGTYYAPCPPKATIQAGTGQERLQALFDDARTVMLQRETENDTLFSFPADFPLNEKFRLKIDGEQVYSTISYCLAHILPDTDHSAELPRWNIFGEKCIDEIDEPYSQGLSTAGIQYNQQKGYEWYFIPGSLVGSSKPGYSIMSAEVVSDSLLHYISACRELSVQKFSLAFESFFHLQFPAWSAATNQPEIGQYKRWALTLLNSLGHIEYEYSQNRLFVNASQLVPLPARRGRRAALTGLRTPDMLNRLRDVANAEGVSVSVENHPEDYKYHLLPSVVTLIADGNDSTLCGQRAIEKVALKLNLPYNPARLPQYGLLELSAGLRDYEKLVFETKPEDITLLSYCAYPFDAEALNFKKTVAEFDKAFALVEYQKAAWDRPVYLWKDGKSHLVDRRWGKFYMLHHLKRKVIWKNDKTNDLIIPSSLPLPRHFARALLLMSGKAPATLSYPNPYSVGNILCHQYESCGNLLASNFLSKLGQ